MMRTQIIIAYSLFFISIGSISKAQDVHFSQYYNTPLLINPALTGDFFGKARFIMNYRNQWQSITVNPYRTIAFSGDGLFLKDKLAFGLQFFNDKSGDANLGTTELCASIATGIHLNKNNYLRFGLQTWWSQQSLNTSALTWNSQYDGTVINPEIASGETGFQKFHYFDMSTGLLWKHLFPNKTVWNFGLSAYHISHPQYSYLGSNMSLPIRWNLHADLSILLGENTNMTLHPSLLFMKQGTLNEEDIGVYIRYKLGLNSKYTGAYKNSFVNFGGYYRVKDAVIAYTRFDFYNQYSIGFSYDFNVSKFKTVTLIKGGLELSLICYFK